MRTKDYVVRITRTIRETAEIEIECDARMDIDEIEDMVYERYRQGEYDDEFEEEYGQDEPDIYVEEW